MGSGPLTPVDSPRAAIEKVIQQKASPGGGIVKNMSGLKLEGEEYDPLTARAQHRDDGINTDFKVGEGNSSW